MNSLQVFALAAGFALLLSGHVSAADAKLLPVPSAGINSLDQAGLRYYQQMGPLEYTAHALPSPPYPAWRLRFTLHPQMENDVLSGYQVNADRINLSPLIYQELVDSYGKEAADPALNNTAPNDRHTLPFIIVQNLAADLLAEELAEPTIPPTHQACGLQPDCGKTWIDDEGDWGQAETIEPELAPWKTTSAVPMLLRTLAKQANWLQKDNGGYQWVVPEQPEGLSDKRPWVEVTVDNYPGNGGMLLADWIETVGDDSASARAIRLLYDPVTPEQAMVYSGWLCARGNNTKKVAQQCP